MRAERKFTLVLLRHGESEWNRLNRFTGWVDIGLSRRGAEEARNAGKLLKGNGFRFDLIFTSVLKRAVSTTLIVQREMGGKGADVMERWRLNERHYGALQGLNKDEMRKKYGEEQVFRWRRSYNERPPQLSEEEAMKLLVRGKYKGLRKGEVPKGESLEDCVKRVLPCWKKEIVPRIKKGKRVLISAHGNSIRALVKRLEGMPDDEIQKLEIPTGKPLVYELDGKLKPIRHYYLE